MQSYLSNLEPYFLHFKKSVDQSCQDFVVKLKKILIFFETFLEAKGNQNLSAIEDQICKDSKKALDCKNHCNDKA